MSWIGGGVSGEARFVEEQMAESRHNLQNSVSLGRRAVEDAL